MKAFIRIVFYSFFLTTILTTTTTTAQTTIYESLVEQGHDIIREYSQKKVIGTWSLQKGGVIVTKRVDEGGSFTANYINSKTTKKFTGNFLWSDDRKTLKAELGPDAKTAFSSSTGFMPGGKPNSAPPKVYDQQGGVIIETLTVDEEQSAAINAAGDQIVQLKGRVSVLERQVKELAADNNGHDQDILFLETLLLEHDSLISLLLSQQQQLQAAQKKPEIFQSSAPRSGFIGAQYSQGIIEGIEGLGPVGSADFAGYGVNIGGTFPFSGLQRVSLTAALSGSSVELTPHYADFQEGEELSAYQLGVLLALSYEIVDGVYVGAGAEAHMSLWKYKYTEFNNTQVTGSVTSVAPYAQVGYWHKNFGVWGRYSNDARLTLGAAYHFPYKDRSKKG